MIAHLVTHAHTEQIAEQDARTWVLSEQGRLQAAALVGAPFWQHVESIAAIIVSSEPKTRLTADPASRHYNLPIIEDARLDELRRGGWIENYGETVAKALENPAVSVSEWEPARSALERAIEAVEHLKFIYPSAQVVIVGHGISLSLLRAWLLGQPHVNLTEWRTLPFGAWATVDFQQRTIVQDFVFGTGSR